MLPGRDRPDQHRAVEGLAHYEIRELRGCEALVGHAQQPDLSKVREPRRQRLEHLTGRPIEVLGSECRELARLADQEPPKRDHLGTHDLECQPAPQVVEGGVQVRSRDSDRELLAHAASKGLRECHDVGHDPNEERALVGIVVVQGALREAGQRRDLLHRRARIALAQEQLARSLDDSRSRADDARIIRPWARRASSTPATPRGPFDSYTHE